MMQQIPPGMASVNGRAPVPLNQAVEEVVDAFERKLQGQRERPAKDVFDKAEPGGIAPERLRSIVERVERLEEERKALSSDIKDIFSEAKSAGFNVAALRQLIRMRKWEPAELEEHEALIDLYRRALGM